MATSVICVNVPQFALRKFHRFTGLHAIGAVRHCEEISDTGCCDRGNPRMYPEGGGSKGVRPPLFRQP